MEFNAITEGGFKALTYLFITLFAYCAWHLGDDYAKKTKNVWIMILKGLTTIFVIAFFSNATLGTHTENCDDDPIRGQCDSVQDYQPTTKQYYSNFTYYIVLLGVPYLIGVHNGFKQNTQKLEVENG